MSMENKHLLTKLEEAVSLKHTALVVIDMQNDFCSLGGTIARRGGDISLVQKIIPTLASFLAKCRHIGINPVFIKNEYNSRRMPVSMKEALSYRGSVPATLPGSWGASFVESCTPLKGEKVFKKYCYDATTNSRFIKFLQSKKYKTIVLTGVATNICVETTARSASMANYYVVIVEDCVAGFSLDSHETALFNLKNYFCRLVTSAELLKIWSKA